MLLTRRIFFYSFILLYLVFCPILIFYALGYIVDPGEKQPIVKGGLIYLSTTPSGATVYLGKRKYFRKTPVILSELIPGSYELKVVRKKYEPWVKSIPVEAGKATVLERILLLPEVWKQEQVISESFQDLIPIPGSQLFILAKSELAQDLFIYDRRLDEFEKLFPLSAPFREARIMNYFFVEKSASFILQLDSEEGEQYIWVLPRRKDVRFKNITGLFLDKPEHIEWDYADREKIFSLQNGFLDAVNVRTKSTTPTLVSGVRGFGIKDKKIYALKDNFTLEWLNSKGESEKVLFDDTVLGSKLFNRELYKIKIFSSDIILFVGENGALIGNRYPYQFLEEGLIGSQFDSQSDRLLIWTRKSVGIIDFKKQKPTGQTFESGAQLIWLYQKGEKIEQAFSVFDGSHVLFRDKNKVYLIELETHGDPHLYQILEVKEKSSIYYHEDSGNLYYLDPATGHLIELELLPKKEILTLPFPERREEQKQIEIKSL